MPQALKAIRAADIITVGPGSLYTSILPNLLVAQVARVIGQSRATKIFVNNLMTQPGETDGYSAREHLETIKKYAPEIHFDFVVVNNRRISSEQAERYAAEGAYQIGIDDPIDDALDQTTEIVRADLVVRRRKGATQLGASGGSRAQLPQASAEYCRRLNWFMSDKTTSSKPLNVLIMAAGLGTRMKSNRAKVLHELGGSPLIAHVCQNGSGFGPAANHRYCRSPGRGS